MRGIQIINNGNRTHKRPKAYDEIETRIGLTAWLNTKNVGGKFLPESKNFFSNHLVSSIETLQAY